LADHLSRVTESEVIVGFNELCAPDLDAALEQAVEKGADQIAVVTPMMSRGGEHAEVDIPEAVRRAQERHPLIGMVYVWPFDTAQVVGFLAAKIREYIHRTG
jgi:sirohydrochlorin cobaltochelatase